MKIDIGNGKILGTKRVSQNGQISGFTEYAGQEVLVILPEGEPDIKLDAREYVRELQEASNEYMKVAFDQYKGLKRKFESPERATNQFMDKYAPRSFKGLYGKVESFVKEQVEATERRVERALDRDDDAPRSESPADAAAGAGTPSNEPKEQ